MRLSRQETYISVLAFIKSTPPLQVTCYHSEAKGQTVQHIYHEIYLYICAQNNCKLRTWGCWLVLVWRRVPVRHTWWTGQWPTWTRSTPERWETGIEVDYSSLLDLQVIHRIAVGMPIVSTFSGCTRELTALSPVALETLTMAPLLAIRWGTASIVRWYIDLTLVFIVTSNCARVVCSMDPPVAIPALLTWNQSWVWNAGWHSASKP